MYDGVHLLRGVIREGPDFPSRACPPPFQLLSFLWGWGWGVFLHGLLQAAALQAAALVYIDFGAPLGTAAIAVDIAGFPRLCVRRCTPMHACWQVLLYTTLCYVEGDFLWMSTGGGGGLKRPTPTLGRTSSLTSEEMAEDDVDFRNALLSFLEDVEFSPDGAAEAHGDSGTQQQQHPHPQQQQHHHHQHLAQDALSTAANPQVRTQLGSGLADVTQPPAPFTSFTMGQVSSTAPLQQAPQQQGRATAKDTQQQSKPRRKRGPTSQQKVAELEAQVAAQLSKLQQLSMDNAFMAERVRMLELVRRGWAPHVSAPPPATHKLQTCPHSVDAARRAGHQGTRRAAGAHTAAGRGPAAQPVRRHRRDATGVSQQHARLGAPPARSPLLMRPAAAWACCPLCTAGAITACAPSRLAPMRECRTRTTTGLCVQMAHAARAPAAVRSAACRSSRRQARPGWPTSLSRCAAASPCAWRRCCPSWSSTPTSSTGRRQAPAGRWPRTTPTGPPCRSTPRWTARCCRCGCAGRGGGESSSPATAEGSRGRSLPRGGAPCRAVRRPPLLAAR